MRPISLQVEGFTSFREPLTIDFSQLDLFAITGPTGAGKTSLIDAIVFALYGCTPRAEKNVSELISLGADHLAVLLEFSSGPDHFRIARRMRRSSSGSVSSDRRLEKKENGEWRSLASSDRQVKKEIERRLGLDFNGFTKSVVLPQGEFDRFLKGKPEERRKILSDLLQLQVYEKMGMLARLTERELNAQAVTLQEQLEGSLAGATLENRRVIEQQLQLLEREQQTLKKSLDDLGRAEGPAAGIRVKSLELNRLRKDEETFRRSFERAQFDQQQLLSERQNFQKELELLDAQIKSAAYDQDLHMELNLLVPRSAALTRVRRAVHGDRQRHAVLERELQQLAEDQIRAEQNKEATATQLSSAREKVARIDKEHRAQVEKHGVPEVLFLLAERVQSCKDLELKCDRDKVEIDQLKLQQQNLESLLQREEEQARDLQKRVEEAHDRLAHLQRLHSADHLRQHLAEGQDCPVCGQTVGQLPAAAEIPVLAAAERDLAKQNRDSARHLKRIAETRMDLALLPPRLEALEKTRQAKIDQISGQREEGARALGGKPGPELAGDLHALATHSRSLAEQLLAGGKEVESLQNIHSKVLDEYKTLAHTQLLKQREAVSLEQNLEKTVAEATLLEQELGKWRDDPSIHQQLEKQEAARTLTVQLGKKTEQLRQALALVQEKCNCTDKELHTLSHQLRQCAESRQRLSQDLEKEKQILFKMIPDLESTEECGRDELDQIRGRKTDLEGRHNQSAGKIGESRERLRQIEKRIEEAAAIRERRKSLQEQAVLAQELGRSLRANQFVSFIQEEALARLAADATLQLLSLSSDRYSFSVKGGDFYVIDHWNADEKRPVTTLSGGESFLASLSLALALAESLSEFCTDREHFSLESLFLDEGFSTLDAETLEEVVQGVEALAARDRMIGVISHIPEMAERFPHRINVKKAIGGSTIEVQ